MATSDEPAAGPASEAEAAADELPAFTHDTFKSCLRPAFAEFVASGVFVYVACGAAANTSQFYNPGPIVISIALAFGLTLFTLAFMIGHISGGHLNPVISMVFVMLKKISLKRGLMYVFAQFTGTLVGVALLKASTPAVWHNGASGLAVPNCLAANQVHAGLTSGVALLVEIILTGWLLMVVCAATDSNKSNQTLIPLAIGVCVTCCHLIALPIDGCSLNPTRSFASAAIAIYTPGCESVWNDHWVFWFGPFFGGALGGIVYDFVFHDGGTRGESLLKQYLNPARLAART